MSSASSSSLHSAIGFLPSPLPPTIDLPTDINPAHDVSKLSQDQQTKYHEAVRYFSDDGYRVGKRGLPAAALSSELNVDESANADGVIESGKLTEDEMIFLSQEGIIRFLIATKWDLQAALLRIDKCLAWRRAFGCYDIRKMSEDCAAESPSGKQFVIGYSTSGMPVLHMLPNRSTTKAGKRQMIHAVYMLERTCDLFPPGVSNLCLIIDFAGKSSAPTSPGQARQFISILQDCYPERLGKAILLSVPWIVKKFLDFAFTFVDPVTKKKVAWNVDIVKEAIVPQEAAVDMYGGNIKFAYEHDQYWPALLEVCLERRETYRKAWRELGGGVGQREWDFKRAGMDILRTGNKPSKRDSVASKTAPGPPVGKTTSTPRQSMDQSNGIANRNSQDQNGYSHFDSVNSQATTLVGVEEGDVDSKLAAAAADMSLQSRPMTTQVA